MLEKILEIIANQLQMEVDEIGEESGIIDDLGADSLDIVSILMAVEDELGITVPDDVITTLKTPKDIAAYIESAKK